MAAAQNNNVIDKSNFSPFAGTKLTDSDTLTNISEKKKKKCTFTGCCCGCYNFYSAGAWRNLWRCSCLCPLLEHNVDVGGARLYTRHHFSSVPRRRHSWRRRCSSFWSNVWWTTWWQICLAFMSTWMILSSGVTPGRNMLTVSFSCLPSCLPPSWLSPNEFGYIHTTILGHVVGQGQFSPVTPTVDAIVQYTTPADKKGVMRLLGPLEYYRQFCHNFVLVFWPPDWPPEFQEDLPVDKRLSEDIRQSKGPPGKHSSVPDLQKPFLQHIDASDSEVSAVISHNSSGVPYPICYLYQIFKSCQKAYATIEKETFGIVLAVEKFRVHPPPPFPWSADNRLCRS